jgi:hypothetical protein
MRAKSSARWLQMILELIEMMPVLNDEIQTAETFGALRAEFLD